MANLILSPTAISSYLYCPRKLFLERILGLVKIPKESMVKGTVKHEIFEEINNAEERIIKNIQEKDHEKILNSYKKEYSLIARKTIIKHIKELKKHDIDELELFTNFWKTLLSEAEDKAKNSFNFIEEHNIFGEELWIKLTPKIVSEYRISDDELQIRGIIDEIREYEKISIPVELKSGKSPSVGVWPGHKAQIAVYMLILKNQGRTIKEGIIKYIDEKKEVAIPMNTLLEDETKKQIETVRNLLTEKILPKHIDSPNKCTACQLKEECYDKDFIDQKLKEKKIA